MDIRNEPGIKRAYQLVESGRLFKPVDFDVAQTELVTSEEVALGTIYSSGSGDEDLSWPEVMEEESTRLYDYLFERADNRDISEQADQISDEIFDLIQKQARRSPVSEFLDAVCADFGGIILSSALGLGDENVFQRMLAVYERGGIPCGLVNGHADGPLRVFLPKA